MGKNINAINDVKKTINSNCNQQNNKNNYIISDNKNVYLYNIKHNYHIIQKNIDILKEVNINFINFLSINISDYLNIDKIDVKLKEIKIAINRYDWKNIKKPIILNTIQIEASKDCFFLVFSFDFLSMIIENLFGGNILGVNKNNYNKKITTAESKIIKRITKIVIQAYEKSMKIFFSIKVNHIKSKFFSDDKSAFFLKNSIFAITTFHLYIGTLKSIFSIMIPLVIIEKYFLHTENTEKLKKNNNGIKEKILHHVNNLNLTLTVQLRANVISLPNILKLKIGDIIPIQKPEDGIVYVDTFPILLGQYKIVNKKHALCIKNLIKSDFK
ncbi:FliM/FliN family flagellar motor switch protein [Buchnera aphidicola]|uniref:FliM/FliN family flagellar motor switch protein n=1 Tax=Buchnera aphidicola TaxID=9 RepID=UPI0034638C7B